MAIMLTCCFRLSVKGGSIASGIYTLIYYTIMVAGGTIYVDSVTYSTNNETNFFYSLGQFVEGSYPIIIANVFCSILMVLASVIMLIGLRINNRLMLLPWLIMIVMTTFVDFVYTVYVIGTESISAMFIFIVTLDFAICALNIYCIVCVVSQYQIFASEDTWRRENGHLQRRCSKDRTVPYLGNDCTVKLPTVVKCSSSPQHVKLIGESKDGSCDVQNSDKIPVKCIESNGVLGPCHNLLSVKSISAQDETGMNTLDLGLWTYEECQNRDRRRSSTKHVQFQQTQQDNGESSLDNDEIQSSSTSDAKSNSVSNEALSSTRPLPQIDDSRKMSYSAVANERSPLLDQKPITTDL